MGAEPRGQQRLMSVAEGGVGEQQGLLLQHPLGELLRTQLFELVAYPRGDRFLNVEGGDRRRETALWLWAPLQQGIAVDDGVRQKGQQSRGSVAAPLRAKQVGSV